MAAFVARLIQAMAGARVMRLQIYVDDPCVLGTAQDRKLLMTVVILLWKAVGIRLAFKKAVCGADVLWIGAQVTAGSGRQVGSGESPAGDRRRSGGRNQFS